MQLRERERGTDFEVNLTPLIDVVFLLLIFFVLTTTFRQEVVLELDLPVATSATVADVPEPLRVVVTADGEITAAGDSAWRQRLALEAQREVPAPLWLQADRAAPHGAVVSVMDYAREVGVLKLSIVTAAEDD